MVAEVVSYGPPEVTPFADPVTFNEVFRLVMTQRFGTPIQVMNTFHFGRETAGGSNTTLVTDWRDFIVPTWKSVVTNSMNFVEVSAQRIAPAQDAIVAAALSGTGSAAGSMPAPAPAAGVITWRTQLFGRRRRGRTYVSGLTYDATYSNGYNWTAAQITRLTTLGNAILNRYTLGGNPGAFQLICWSRTTAFEPNQIDWRLGASMVNRFTVQPYVATMGSRRSGRGI